MKITASSTRALEEDFIQRIASSEGKNHSLAEDSPYKELLTAFPEITRVEAKAKGKKHQVEHHIERLDLRIFKGRDFHLRAKS
ncbi:hypothetical protein HNY73_016224 [Argiope bruennichi]|uniref:Uncharacterized protein n=1 Tax=Argiope bruennichi TaxID=94029 RepID=A0A8T0EHT0_ARGBR|nr:hypothetical protein HNY73_016224 [Argiope bruennichi]